MKLNSNKAGLFEDSLFNLATSPPAHLQISRINKNADINCYMWRHLFLCNREMLKEGENLHIFWTTSGISMKFSENIWLIILSHKKQGFVFFLENTFLEKSQGEGQMDSAAFFGLRRSSKDKISIRNLIRFHGGFWVEDPRYFHNSFCWNLLFKIFYFKYYWAFSLKTKKNLHKIKRQKKRRKTFKNFFI